jgi:hypothetical protein
MGGDSGGERLTRTLSDEHGRVERLRKLGGRNERLCRHELELCSRREGAIELEVAAQKGLIAGGQGRINNIELLHVPRKLTCARRSLTDRVDGLRGFLAPRNKPRMHRSVGCDYDRDP